MKRFTASLEVIEMYTDKVLSTRIIGSYDTQDEALAAARAARQRGETVVIGVPNEVFNEEEDMSPREMAEVEVDWLILFNEL